MTKLHLAALIAGFLIVTPGVAFGQMTVDGSTVETYERSIRAMADSLPLADRETFGLGLMNIIIWDYPASAGATGLAVMSLMTPALAAAHITLDGVTIDEIMDRGHAVVAQQQTSETTTSSPVSPGLADEARACIQTVVKVTDFTINRNEYGIHKLSVSVENGLGWPLAGLGFVGVVTSPNRSTPWAEQALPVMVPGGIEPNEVKKVEFDFYGLPEDLPLDANFGLSLVDVVDADERPLIGDGQIASFMKDEHTPFACLLPASAL